MAVVKGHDCAGHKSYSRWIGYSITSTSTN